MSVTQGVDVDVRPRGRTPIRRAALAALLAGIAVPVAGSPSAPASALAGSGREQQLGSFSAAFEQAGPTCTTNKDGLQACKPAAASAVVLADGRIVYWNGLEGTENVAFNTVAEYGDTAVNDQSRVLDLRSGTPSWITPAPADSGVTPATPDYIVPGVTSGAADPNTHNDGALFCSDQVQLADGRVFDAGGTSYYNEPQIPGTRYGVVELQGLKVSRIFDPATNTWSQSGSMNYGRWYPGLVTLADGRVFVASGVTKLIKPVYSSSPTDSGRNVTQTETYDPGTGTWAYNGTTADKSLPLFPRLHLLPDGKVLYDAAGQTFNPFGQAYDEALWNMDSVYDPAARTWTDIGIPGLAAGTGTPLVGFRGSSFDVMLPLKAPYKQVSFLAAGGVMGVSPGTYLATANSAIHTIDTAAGDALTTTPTGDLANARWYSSGVLLPDGTVMAFSGANRDEVVLPGSETAITQAELFDPATNTWTPMASAGHQRTYHNTAVLLPDGRVLVGGHAPIPTGYAYNQTLPGQAPSQRDPSFEIYSPPYMFKGARPAITHAPTSIGYGGAFMMKLGSEADATAVAHGGSVVLQRYTSLTHLVDGDQRQVVLNVLGQDGNVLFVSTPPSAAVAPAGPYMLFASKKTASGLIPSVAKPVFVNHLMPRWVTGRTAGQPAQPPAPPAQPVPGPVIPAPPQLPGSSSTQPATLASASMAQPAVADIRRTALQVLGI